MSGGGRQVAAEGVSEGIVEDVLERSREFFESFLWESQVGERVRSRLARVGIDPQILSEFGVGYAPTETRLLLDHLEQREHTASELRAAGLTIASERSYQHVVFHGRIMFPMRGRAGRIVGFAGLATHLGPSWPLWLTSAREGAFDANSALFGLQQAAPAIARSGRALVLRDCVQVLALRQQGQDDAVAVIQSPITREHLAQLGSLAGSETLQLTRRDGRLGVVAAPESLEVQPDAFASRLTPSGFSIANASRGRPATRREAPGPPRNAKWEPPPTRPIVYLGGILVGVGIPIGLLLIAEPHNEATRGATGPLNVVVVGLAVAYLVLAVLVSRRSARIRAQSKARRMREPWARGSDEWQPRGWTHHRLEEVLVGAAAASALTCIVLLLTIGGFLG